MNDPKDIPLDPEEQRKWLIDHKAERGLSWSELGPRIGIAHQTLSTFGGNTYKGDLNRIASAIFRYRQGLLAQATIAVQMPEPPKFYATPSTSRMEFMFKMAQRGRITLIATGPGTSKTQAIRHYHASVAQVWVATMRPSTAGIPTMQIEVLRALGEPDAKGTPQGMSRRIMDKVVNTGGLLVIDEAQHLGEKALEEIRSWHDETGIGICLAGNEDVLLRLEHGNRKHAFARLASRVAQRLIFHVASEGDAQCLADAWGVEDEACRRFIVSIAVKPGSLRNCTMMLETATMLAAGENDTLKLSHLQDAWSMLSTRALAV